MRKNNFLIIGGNSSLGKAIASFLIKETNSRVLVSTRNKSSIDIEENADFNMISEIDLLSETDLEKLREKANSFFKEDFNIINAVGRYFKDGHQNFLNISLTEANEIFQSNFTTVYNTAKYLIPLQITKGGGHFIGFSCTSVNYKYPMMAAFASAKTALETFMGCLANEHYKDGILANTFQLSTLDTAEERRLKPTEDYHNWLDVNEIAKFVFDFVNSENRFVSGNNIHLYKYSPSFFGKSFFNRINVKNE